MAKDAERFNRQLGGNVAASETAEPEPADLMQREIAERKRRALQLADRFDDLPSDDYAEFLLASDAAGLDPRLHHRVRAVRGAAAAAEGRVMTMARCPVVAQPTEYCRVETRCERAAGHPGPHVATLSESSRRLWQDVTCHIYPPTAPPPLPGTDT